MSRAPLVIVFGVLAWSTFLAVGAYRKNFRETRWDRAAIVLGCGVAFVAFWGVMLLARRNRLRREAMEDDHPGESQ